MKYFKLGLKLYSIDIPLASEVQRLKAGGFFDFIELYAVPGSYSHTIETWENLNVPFVIHAPHSYDGMNLAQAERRLENSQHFKESQQFADRLGSDTIIIHGGNNGLLQETIYNLCLFNDHRICLENKPKIGINNELCVGFTPSEFREVALSGALHGTALDFGHAIYAANSIGIERNKILKDFLQFNPRIYHLADGDLLSEKDVHLNLGKGSFNLTELLDKIPNNSLVTIETPRNPAKGLCDFLDDVAFIKDKIHFNSKLFI
ncbi:MAG: hypothetical protein AAB257_09735 [Nitrospinota bacterium]